MMKWTDNESDEQYADRHYKLWCARQPLFQMTAEELARVYDRVVQKFNAACDKLEAEDTGQKVARLLHDTLGRRTYVVPEPLDIQNSGCLPKDWA